METRFLFMCSFALAGSTLVLAQDYRQEASLPVMGRITDGENKLEGCEVITYRGNERITTVLTDKSGKFRAELALNGEFSLEFHKKGFVPKRILVDTSFPLQMDDLMFDPLMMDISLLATDKYQGVATDELDFPFARVRFDTKTQTFAQDQEWTMDMQRTNGALLLAAGRVEKRSK